jgi:CRAL/TRIO domain
MEMLGTLLEASTFQLPSVGHLFTLVAIIGFWKYGPPVYAFDPTPGPANSKPHHHHPMLQQSSSSEIPPPPPPPARALSSEWETDSSHEEEDRHSPDSSFVEEEPSQFLQTHAPESTPAERYRFLTARNGNEEKALENLHKYLAWRNQYQPLIQQQETKFPIDQDDPDLHDWIVASQTALHANQQTKDGWQWLPRVVQTHRWNPSSNQPPQQVAVDSEGHTIVHMIPARIDERICTVETYSLAIALYMDRKLNRASLDRMTLLIDTRPGEGWRNIAAVRLLPFIQHIVQLMLTLAPERLHRTVVYNIPFALTWLFRSVQAFLDPVTARKIVVVAGSAGMEAPFPIETLARYMSPEVAWLCEQERLASFTS